MSRTTPNPHPAPFSLTLHRALLDGRENDFKAAIRSGLDPAFLRMIEGNTDEAVVGSP